MCCMWLAGNTGCKNDAKNRHLGMIAQLCRAMSPQLRHVSAIRKKLVKQPYLPHMSSQYGELWSTSGWDLLASLGHPSKFQRVSCLGSITARQCSSGRQPNCSVEQRAPPIFGRAAMTVGIGRHSSFHKFTDSFIFCFLFLLYTVCLGKVSRKCLAVTVASVVCF